MHQMIIHLNDQQINIYCYSSYSVFIRTQITERYGRAMMIGIVTSRYNNDKDKWDNNLEIITKATLFSWLFRPLCSPLPLRENNNIKPSKGTAFVVVNLLYTRWSMTSHTFWQPAWWLCYPAQTHSCLWCCQTQMLETWKVLFFPLINIC